MAVETDSLALTNEVTAIGRFKEADYIMNVPNISAKHAEFIRIDNPYLLRIFKLREGIYAFLYWN